MTKKNTKSKKNAKSSVDTLYRLKNPGPDVPEWFAELAGRFGISNRQNAGIITEARQ